MKQKKGILIAILAAAFVMNAAIGVSPILAEIGKSFPEASASQIQMVYTVSSLVMLPIMLLAGKMCNYVTKKNLTLFGLIVMLIGGIMPTVLHSRLWMLYVASGIMGFGLAFVNVINSTLISDHFDGIEKGAVMGIQSAVLSIGGAIVSWGAGNIAARAAWHLAYLMFLIIVPLAVVVVILLPQDKVVPPAEAAKQGKVIHKRLVYFAALGFFESMFVAVFNTNIAMFLDQIGLGGADVAGVVNSIFMIVGIPAGFLLGAIIKKLGRNTSPIMILVIGAGMFCVAFAHSTALVYVGAFLVGLGFAVRNPTDITFAANMVPAASAGLGIAVLNAFGSVAGFISPVVMNGLSGAMDGSIRTTFILAGIGLAAVGVIYLIFNPVRKEEVG